LDSALISLVKPSLMRILIIEDDTEIADYVVAGLRRHGHVAEHVSDGREGIVSAAGGKFDAIVVDRLLPGTDGLTVVKTLRSVGIKAGIIFLTARAGVDDRVEGLEAGGDDYLTKPFAFSELLARLHSLGRRPPLSNVETILRVANMELDLIAHRAKRGGRDIELKPREFRLLECLMRNADRVVTRTMLLEKVWNFHFDPKTKIVETHMSRLRAKVSLGDEPELIHTIRGAGYVLRAPV
jgi:two-component system OmpR family response regulator